MIPRILLLGSEGNVGWELQRALAPLGELLPHGRATCDLGNLDQLQQVIRESAPHIIVNAGAYTAVDKAEQDTATAQLINATAVQTIAECAARQGSLFIHYSTDYVFDGNKSGSYIETDSANPQSVYGHSKYMGEQAILASNCRHLILRTSWVFSTRGANFAKTILRLAQERETLRVIADQWGAPTSAELIADVTAHALREVHFRGAPGGIYHLTAAGQTSWHGYAEFLIEQARALGMELNVRDIQPIGTVDYPLPATRPGNSRMDTQKLRSTFNIILPSWQYHARRLLIELLSANR